VADCRGPLWRLAHRWISQAFTGRAGGKLGSRLEDLSFLSVSASSLSSLFRDAARQPTVFPSSPWPWRRSVCVY
jgi:hypothetical protein